MNDIILSADQKIILEYFDSYTPEGVPIKADIWFSLFRLKISETYYFNKFFTESIQRFDDGLIFLHSPVIEGENYHVSQYCEHAKAELICLDIINNTICLISRTPGGSFTVDEISNLKIIFSKHHSGFSEQFEVNRAALKWETLLK